MPDNEKSAAPVMIGSYYDETGEPSERALAYFGEDFAPLWAELDDGRSMEDVVPAVLRMIDAAGDVSREMACAVIVQWDGAWEMGTLGTVAWMWWEEGPFPAYVSPKAYRQALARWELSAREDLPCRACGGQLILEETLAGSVALRSQDVGRAIGDMLPAEVVCEERFAFCANCNAVNEATGYSCQYDTLIPICATERGRNVVRLIHADRCAEREFDQNFEMHDGDEVVADVLAVLPHNARLREACLRNRRYMPKVFLAACED